MAAEQATKEKVVVTIFWGRYSTIESAETIVDPISVRVLDGLLSVSYKVGNLVEKIETNVPFRVRRKEELVKPVPVAPEVDQPHISNMA